MPTSQECTLYAMGAVPFAELARRHPSSVVAVAVASSSRRHALVRSARAAGVVVLVRALAGVAFARDSEVRAAVVFARYFADDAREPLPSQAADASTAARATLASSLAGDAADGVEATLLAALDAASLVAPPIDSDDE